MCMRDNTKPVSLTVGEALSYELSSLDVKLILSARSEDKLVALRDKLKTPENVRFVHTIFDMCVCMQQQCVGLEMFAGWL